jgi:2-C-methyl-D-erythritol 2,4-cyclodiphosphate synthase
VRVGLGFDVHASDPGRPLRLGGVPFEDAPGLSGHSDADVICHAVADALLGGAALGDLGQHFPDSDPAIPGIDGLELLGRVVGMVRGSGLVPSSCDLTVVADGPPVSPHRDAIRENLARVLGVEVASVSVKATRPEGLGLQGDGVGCIAVVTLDDS